MVVLGALGIAAFACTAGSTTGGLGASAPVKQAEVTSPSSGLKVTATISAVTLGEECANTPAAGGASCAAPSSPKAADAGSGDIAPGGCGGFCQGSNVQIAFTATAGTKAATVEIVSVTLHEASTGKLVDTLKSSKPQSWNGSTYAAWDQKVQPASELKASYDLTSPAWSTINGSDSSRTTNAYSTAYTLDVTLSIDGVEVTLESVAVNREPPVAT
ncbi:MAG: hypothetical protein JWO86_3121 [Myxococcaceae bacterium]|nr:hypothetical protein [Myxococcaceae bacterium]